MVPCRNERDSSPGIAPLLPVRPSLVVCCNMASLPFCLSWPGWCFRSLRFVVFDPGLRGHLDGIPGTAKRRGIGQIEIVEFLDPHPMKEGCGKDVDAFGHFCPEIAHDLCSQQ